MASENRTHTPGGSQPLRAGPCQRPGSTTQPTGPMQHEAYPPILPCVSKHLQSKWDKTNYDMHRRKVKSAMATINSTPPRTYGHLQVKMKKQKLEEERVSTIERENSILLQKITHIMQTAGGVDHRNDYIKKSLSTEKRTQELLRITCENGVILQRLAGCRAHYSVQAWRREWLRTLDLMESIARYPRSARNKKSTASLLNGTRSGERG